MGWPGRAPAPRDIESRRGIISTGATRLTLSRKCRTAAVGPEIANSEAKIRASKKKDRSLTPATTKAAMHHAWTAKATVHHTRTAKAAVEEAAVMYKAAVTEKPAVTKGAAVVNKAPIPKEEAAIMEDPAAPPTGPAPTPAAPTPTGCNHPGGSIVRRCVPITSIGIVISAGRCGRIIITGYTHTNADERRRIRLHCNSASEERQSGGHHNDCKSWPPVVRNNIGHDHPPKLDRPYTHIMGRTAFQFE